MSKICGYCGGEGFELVHGAIDSAENIYQDCPICKGTGDPRFTTTDRLQQTSWLRKLARDIAWNADEGSAEELVDYALSGEDATTIPSWFDENDLRLLTRMVERRIA